MIRKLAAYVILGISSKGYKEVLTIQVHGNESAKYWLSVLSELKNRRIRDILIMCTDGLSGINGYSALGKIAAIPCQNAKK